MRISFFDLDNDIVFDDEHINILEIVDTKYFTNMILNFNSYCNGEKDDNYILLFDKEETLNFSKHAMILFDIFNI